MKPTPFEYCRPATLDETFDLLARFGDDGRILAGGQSLVPALNMRLATPRAVIDINRLPGLDAIRLAPEGLVIGALARHDAVERSPLVARRAPLIAAAMPHVGHAAIRSRGTFGGSLALADPAAELPACVLRSTRRSAWHAGGAGATFLQPTSSAACTRRRSSLVRSSRRSSCRRPESGGARRSTSWRAATVTLRWSGWRRTAAWMRARSARSGSCSSVSAPRR